MVRLHEQVPTRVSHEVGTPPPAHKQVPTRVSYDVGKTPRPQSRPAFGGATPYPTPTKKPPRGPALGPRVVSGASGVQKSFSAMFLKVFWSWCYEQSEIPEQHIPGRRGAFLVGLGHGLVALMHFGARWGDPEIFMFANQVPRKSGAPGMTWA